jgi:hypothetical protein
MCEAFNLEGAALVHNVLATIENINYTLTMNGKIMHYLGGEGTTIDLSEINGAVENPLLIEKYYRGLYNELHAADAGYTKSGMFSKGFSLHKEMGKKMNGIIIPGDDENNGVLIKKFTKTSFAIVYESGFYIMACENEEEFTFVFALLQTFIECNCDVTF